MTRNCYNKNYKKSNFYMSRRAVFNYSASHNITCRYDTTSREIEI